MKEVRPRPPISFDAVVAGEVRPLEPRTAEAPIQVPESPSLELTKVKSKSSPKPVAATATNQE
jgi:hypothetical protein